MSRAHSPRESRSDGDISFVTTTDDDVPETLLDATTLLRMPRNAPKRSSLRSFRNLRLISLILHLTLVAIHLALLGISHNNLEHHLIFSSSLHTQKIVSFSVTVILTSFVTVYSIVLVFVTQGLSTRRSLIVDQTLTATHDIAAAWAGLGSAMVHTWRQKAVPASVIGVLSAFLYLGNILVLHITIPALLSLQSFNSSQPVPVPTRSFPALNLSGYDLSDELERKNTMDSMTIYAQSSLQFLPSVLQSTTAVGLYDATLYDVLEPNGGTRNVTVNATGFSVSCNFLTDFKLEFDPDMGRWDVSSKNGSYLGVMEPTSKGIISSLPSGLDVEGALLYSTAQIVDSSGNMASQVNLTPPLTEGYAVSAQLLQCSQSLVNQQAVVDPQSHQLISVTPNITKTSSTWPSPVISPSVHSAGKEFLSTIPLMALAQDWYGLNPASALGRVYEWDANFTNMTRSPLSFGDIFLSQKLNLLPLYPDTDPCVNLHDLENALSVIFASMMWTIGNVPVPQWYAEVAGLSGSPFRLLQGNVMVTQEFTQIRLDLSIIAVVAGLVVSIALTLLSLPSTIFHRNTTDNQDIPIDGTGFLNSIWLYRNHPELEGLLEQVEHPTDDNLREAGMIRTNLVGEGLHRRKSHESF